VIIEARDDNRSGFIRDTCRDLFPAFAAAVVEDDLGPLAPRAIDFHQRRVRGHDDRRMDPKAARRNCDAACMIARRESDNAVPALLARELKQPVRRAAQFEGAARLKTLAFETHANAVDGAFEERSALDLTLQALRRFENVFTID